MSKVLDRLEGDGYLPNPKDLKPYPEMPSILKNSVSDLDDELIDAVAEVRNDYNNALYDYELQQTQYLLKIVSGLREFRRDAEEEFGIINNPKADMFYEKSLKHCEGLEEMYMFYYYYHDLIL